MRGAFNKIAFALVIALIASGEVIKVVRACCLEDKSGNFDAVLTLDTCNVGSLCTLSDSSGAI